jgi:ribosomal protein L32
MSSRMRKTPGQTGNRRSHHGVEKPRLSKDDGVYHMRHRASLETGTYRGRQVIDVQTKRQKKLKRARQKAKDRGDDPGEISPNDFGVDQSLETDGS